LKRLKNFIDIQKQQDKEKRIWLVIVKRFAGSAAGKGRNYS